MLRAAAATLLLLAAPAGAQAAVVGGYPGSPTEGKVPGSPPAVAYTAAPGETNAVTVTAEPPEVVFREAGAPLTAAGSCRLVSPAEARCPDVGRLEISLGDGNDSAALPGALTPFVSVSGGDGDDTISGPTGFVTDLPDRDDLYVLSGGAGNDTIQGGPLPESIDGGPGTDVLRGGDGGDLLTGGADADELHGEEGSDVLQGDPRDAAAAPDVLDGGPGRDRAVWDTSAPVRVDLADPGLDGREREFDNPQFVEDLTGGTGPNTLLGDDGPNRLEARGDGVQELRGRGGDDVLLAASPNAIAGDDVLLDGGAGDDVLGGDQQPVCGSGRDVISAAAVVRDCERVQLGAFTLGLRPRVRGRSVLLDVRREPTPIVSGYAARRRGVRLATAFAETTVAARTQVFPRAGTVVLPLTARGRALLARRTSLAVHLGAARLVLRR